MRLFTLYCVIKIEFGIPEHGWLPTTLNYRDYHLELDISDVPLDPMVQLCGALIQINKGFKEPNRIIWHLLLETCKDFQFGVYLQNSVLTYATTHISFKS